MRFLRPSAPPLDPQDRSPRLVDPGPGAATLALRERLGDDLAVETEARLTPDQRHWWRLAADKTEEAARWRMLAGVPGRQAVEVAYALHHGIEGAEGRTGLRAAMPPEEIHAMVRDEFLTGGSLYYADLMADALGALPAGACLDLGCSSGRVARAAAAAFPDTRWHGCDPNADAIAWANEHLRGIAEFAVQPREPPLPYDDDGFDLVVAISVWSHFATAPAGRWLGEAARVIRPGGHLLLTSHGWDSVAHFAAHRARRPELLQAAIKGLYARGTFFHDEFGDRGDWGLPPDEGWGLAFHALDFLLDLAGPAWRLASFLPARAQGNQDVVVLERRAPQ